MLSTLLHPSKVEATIERIAASLKRDTKPSYKDLRGPALGLLPIVWVGILLSVFQQFVGINVIFYYSNVLWEAVGFEESSAFQTSVFTSLVNIVATFVAIMLVDTPADSAAGVVERLLDAIRHKPADHPASHQPIAFTASIGCTESQPEDDKLTALARADRALYIAKQSGRNRHAWV